MGWQLTGPPRRRCLTGKADVQKMKASCLRWSGKTNSGGWVEGRQWTSEILDRLTKECMPTKKRRTGNRPLWMTCNIMRMLRKQKTLWQAYCGEKYYMADHRQYLAYQSVQKEVKKQIRMAKRKLERSHAKKSKKIPKQFYAYMKSKTSSKVSVRSLRVEEGLVTDDNEMACILNAQYTRVFTRGDTAHLPAPEFLFTGERALSEMRFEERQVVKKLKGIKPTGDGKYIYQHMEEGKCVSHLQEGDQGGSSKLLSRVPDMCVGEGDGKVKEGDRKVDQGQDRGALGEAQSTVTNLLVYMETKLMDEDQAVDVLYLDFSKAFNKVPHMRLLDKCR